MPLPWSKAAPSNNPYESLRGLSIDEQCTTVTFLLVVAIVAQVELFGVLAEQKWVPRNLSRKFTHIGAGSTMLTFMSAYPMGDSWKGRLGVCSILVAFMFAFSFVAYMSDATMKNLPPLLLVRVKRLEGLCVSGKRIDLMGGTFIYCAVLAQVVVFAWSSPLNVISMSALFLGDGLANPVGKWLGRNMQYRVANFGSKSVPGSLTCFVCTLIGAYLWGLLFVWAGHWDTPFDMARYMWAAVWCGLAATAGEAISPPDVDNIYVVLFSNLMGYALAQSGYAPFLLVTKG
mmetsp:Transcript_41848/g.102570  ORF Transcript_41848/g.102570 Transcript_41848/m.102570 type:complete len:288 (+) Transcript_41848:95-958(+)|eukprot:CAMPEP_0206247596 /NCGR_PEP_ID=MMETSP0047_2-20121206/19900_1 /ASSEMBLY_ACC=CAM_ASM_000192 /TAXON_ID=195065 /ORGANISM="Chroomonas mesostigmatica_cf, Strain CCMP1168" /LENGTH=287 /DNA_ID=CAMNT_0053673143 /DNA_START=26 /DNA_END=889 /DNA_ORIENTATION=-